MSGLALINNLSGQMAISSKMPFYMKTYGRKKIQLRTKQLNRKMKKSESYFLNILPPDVAQELKNQGRSKPRALIKSTVMFT